MKLSFLDYTYVRECLFASQSIGSTLHTEFCLAVETDDTMHAREMSMSIRIFINHKMCFPRENIEGFQAGP